MSRFIINRVLQGPADLHEQLPVTATVTEVQFGPDGKTYFCARLDQAITFTPLALNGPADDERGPVGPGATVHEIVFRSTDPAQHPRPGMRAFPIEVSYVIDPSFDPSKDLDFTKIRTVASAEIDALEEESAPTTLDVRDTAVPPPAPNDPGTEVSQQPEMHPASSFTLEDTHAAAASSAAAQFGVGDLQWDTSEGEDPHNWGGTASQPVRSGLAARRINSPLTREGLRARGSR